MASTLPCMDKGGKEMNQQLIMDKKGLQHKISEAIHLITKLRFISNDENIAIGDNLILDDLENINPANIVTQAI